METEGSPPANKKKKSKKKERTVFSDLLVPLELRNQLQFDKNSGEFVANLDNAAIPSSSSNTAALLEATNHKEPRRRHNRVIDALIGQANVAYAKRNIDEAINYLKEAIREDPRHPDAYKQIANLYVDQNQAVTGFEYRLMGANLDNKTEAAEWAEIGETAVKLERIEEAAACYGNAVRCEPDNWFYYEKRIELLEALGMIRFAMGVRLKAAQAISCETSRVDFDWLQNLIKTAAEYYINCNDEDRAMDALKVFLLRCHEFKRSADVQHLALLRMWGDRDSFDECVKSILALCPSIKALNEDGSDSMAITITHMGYQFKPFLPETLDRFEVGEEANTLIIGRLVIYLLQLGRIKPVNSLIDVLLKRAIHDNDEIENLLEIGRTYYKMEFYNYGMLYMEKLLTLDTFERNPDALFLCAVFEQSRNNDEKALALYKEILEIQPSFVNARINLSSVLQRLGQADAALQSLMDCDLDLGTHLPDERLLVRQADMLSEQNNLDQYVRCVRMILVPYFYIIYKNEDFSRRNRSRSTQCNVLYRTMLEYLRDKPIEAQIKRQGAAAYVEERAMDLTSENLHDYCLRLIEILQDQKRYRELLEIVCLASLEPKISNTGSLTFLNMTLFACIKAEHYPLAFEYLRYLHTTFATKTANLEAEVVEAFGERLYNAMNYVFSHHQNICYHRYIMRTEARNPDVKQLQVISGNNSLVTGSYRHALNEYLKVWDRNRDDPLSAFLIALTFVHISCKKDITSRHMLAMRGLAFMQIYDNLRNLPQETLYNMGRLLHQMSMFSSAAHFYQRVLTETDPPKIVKMDEQTGEDRFETAHQYDLKRCAAHNLSLIYENSGNFALARSIREKYCTI
ncbi:hypothetical protein M3Y97_00408000 [Aphelenchoides bicaudatus]|nr:hypothetical protein M3Y97_00408000 [Aphelenchoides bicaudatus]